MRWLRDAGQDVRYAIRSLRRSSGFASIAILTLALGIGATTAIYSVIDTILLQPLPFADSDRLVRIVENVPSPAGRPAVQRGVSYQEFVEWRDRSRTLADAFAVRVGETVVRTGEGRARLWGGWTSANTFSLLGTRAMLGRTLEAGDDDNPNVVVLSFETWQRLFHGDRGAVGTALEFRADFNASFTPELDRPKSMTIVGVMPAAFELPTGPMDFYAPFTIDASKPSPRVTLIGRLRAGVTPAAALDEANVIGSAIRPPRPANAPPLTGPRFEALSVKERMVETWRPALRVLLAAVVVVLLIVCANVANLLLARGTARQREIAVRFAIGASRGRVVRQLMTECVVLAAAGGGLGAAVGALGVTLVKQLTSVDAPGIFRLGFGTTILPRGHEVGIDSRLFAISLAIAGITSLIFGVLPALHVSRTGSLQTMASRGGGDGRRESGVRSALVVGQLAMATALLIAAGLLIRSFITLATVERGYDPSNVLAFQLVFPTDYSVARKARTIDAILDRLRATPEIESAGFTRAGLLIGEALTIGTFVPQGRTVDEMRADPVKPLVRAVSSGYLTAVGARVLDGRELDAADTATSTPAIVISRAVARRFFGAVSPVGQLVDWYPPKGPASPLQVVGVVEDVRNTSPDREPSPEIFVEYRQLLALQQRWGDSTQRQEQTAIGFLSFAVRTRSHPASVAPVVTRIIRAVDSNAGIDAMIPLDRLVANSVARPRFYAVILGVFAGVAAVLAAIGIYGVLAYAVARRTREIGIRMALGAQRSQVLALVLRHGLILTGVGLALGLGGAVAATRLLQGMLFGITPLDPLTIAAVPMLFGLAAALASYLPAKRATAIDPMITLRSE